MIKNSSRNNSAPDCRADGERFVTLGTMAGAGATGSRGIDVGGAGCESGPNCGAANASSIVHSAEEFGATCGRRSTRALLSPDYKAASRKRRLAGQGA